MRRDLWSILALLLFTFLISAWSFSLRNHLFHEAIGSIPTEPSIFSGTIVSTTMLEDGRIKAIASIKGDKDQALRVLIRFDGTALSHEVGAGKSIAFRGIVRPWRKPLSPVHFDGMRYGLSQKLHGHITLADAHLVWLSHEAHPTYFASLKDLMRENCLRAVSLREASMLLALMIGDTGLLSHEQKEIYQSIGAQHLLAVSGLQVTLLAALCFIILLPLFNLILPKRLGHYSKTCAALFTIFASLWFIGICDFSESATRAFLMTSFVLAPTIISRKIDHFDALFVSGLLTILFSPSSIFDLGYLLSYAAVFALLVVGHKIAPFKRSWEQRSRLLSYALVLLASSIAVFLCTAPIIFLTTARFNPLSVIANLLLLPCASLLQIPCIVFGFVGSIFDLPTLIKAAAIFASAMEIIAQILASMLKGLNPAPPSSFSGLLLLACLINVIFFLAKRTRMRALALSLLAICSTGLFLFHDPKLEVTVIAVGQGDSSLFSFTNGQHMLIDAGGSMNGNFDPGKEIILPTLMRKGISEIDVMVITHPDPDHILGAFAIMDEIKVREIWHSGFSPTHPLTKRLLAKAEEKAIRVLSTPLLLGSHAFGASEVQVLAPNTLGEEAFYEELSSNDNSLVLRVVHGPYALLWPGDIERFGEGLLTSLNIDLSANILKAPHHGSKTSSTAGFIDRVKPQHVIYSTGLNNRFLFPHQQVRARYLERNTQEWNTAIDGEITIEIDDRGIRMDGYSTPFKEKKSVVLSG